MAADDLKPLLYFVKEREAIRKRHAIGRLLDNGAYTKDPILATYRFCNVRRRHDRVSQWLIGNVLCSGPPPGDLFNFLLFSAWCRWVNWPPTIKAVIDANLYPHVERVDWAKIGRFVDKLGRTEKVWTGAYMIRAPKQKGAKKGLFIAREVIGKHLKKALPRIGELLAADNATYQSVHAALCEVPNFGSFMAGQVAGDWTYTPWLSNAPDLKTWAPMGPGSVRGFNRIVGNEKLSKRPPADLWEEKLGVWRQRIIKRLGPEYEDLTALDVQNILCETDKFLRVKNGEGRPRARYAPHTY